MHGAVERLQNMVYGARSQGNCCCARNPCYARVFSSLFTASRGVLKDSARLQVYKDKDDEQILVDVKYHDDNIEVAAKLCMRTSLSRSRATPPSVSPYGIMYEHVRT